MEELDALYLTERKAWREWLRKNFNKKKEVWLVYPKKSSGKPRIEYNTAVEEALCYGWIDSTVKSLDGDHTIQRFTQRRPKSSYSQANKERLKWLYKENKIHLSIRESIKAIIDQEFEFPLDILDEIRKNPMAWENYQKLSDPYKRIRIAYIDSARKRPEEFTKRLLNFIAKTKENKFIKGFGGIDKYY
ncbi:YdeI/OmpD-associated family protein [Ulvibacterium marinum]|uniref:Bacteriocin-protection protein n=1 Tax=Ulvibacterium marinum TaxID=2419782 RepID=A0A3B0CE13_9FLAO|nr:YdeI/OmpD-associated family protein [Ulvibacterium marinum]RKN83221.1 hypothetical protein D7Z94_05145 [Ulvibacterium marinum]